MIYLDTSVALAHLLAEDRAPPDDLWNETLVSSRLLEYEVWGLVNARGLAETHGDLASVLLDRLAFLPLSPPVLARALDPFPARVRTPDALHLASIEFLRSQGQRLALATYDQRLEAAARTLEIPIAVL